jgi:serine/threonine protein kinase
MGEVHRVRDTRLHRELAIKVLPTSIAQDADFLARFQAEARAASALNHPNIVTIYDIGSADGVSYILMELVHGKTVRELLDGEPPPLRRTLQIAAQAAEGLAAAHLAESCTATKPENLMVVQGRRRQDPGLWPRQDDALYAEPEKRPARTKQSRRSPESARHGRIHVPEQAADDP